MPIGDDSRRFIPMVLAAIVHFNAQHQYTRDCVHPVPGTGHVSAGGTEVVVTFNRMGGGRVVCRHSLLAQPMELDILAWRAAPAPGTIPLPQHASTAQR